MLSARAARWLVFVLIALASALDSYAAFSAPLFRTPGYARHPSHEGTTLAPAAPIVSDDDDDSPGSGDAPAPLICEPLAPVIFGQAEAWIAKARPAGAIVQHPPCAVPQTGPPPTHTAA
jgi:hypothetical protein